MKFDLTCSMHPKYKAKKYPTSMCAACKILYFLNNGGISVLDYDEKRKDFVELRAK